MRHQTPAEAMHNLLHKYNGTASAGIQPARRCILSILQSKRATTGLDDSAVYAHLRTR